METPQPVDLNRLKGILGNAKAVMQKANVLKPIALSESTKQQIEIEELEEPMHEQLQPQSSQGYTDEQVMNSKLPEAVKKAMLEKRMPQLTMPPSKFTLEDMSDLDDTPMTPNKRNPITKTPIRENVIAKNSDMITISKAELNEMINTKLMDFLTKSYNKTLTEETIKRTINLLIKEGKLTTKKKSI